MEKLGNNNENIKPGDLVSITYDDGFKAKILLIDANSNFTLSGDEKNLIESGEIDLITTDSPMGKELLTRQKGETFKTNINNCVFGISIQ
jgi:transcription elongation GreA/GreB family factor